MQSRQSMAIKTKNYLNLMSALAIRRTSSPLQVIHYVTSKCNAKCAHCYYWHELNQKKNELTLDEIKKMTPSIGPVFFLLIGGGEPFLRPDLVEVIKVYYENNGIKNLSIPTNGTLTEKTIRDCRRILEECPGLAFSLSLSVDGLHEDHDTIRGTKDCFKRLVNTFNEASKLKEEFPNFSVNVICTITSFNQLKLKDIYHFMKTELKPDVFQLNFIRGNPKDPLMKDVDLKYYEEIHRMTDEDFRAKVKSGKMNFKTFKLWARYRMDKIRSNMIVQTVKENKCQTPCYAGIYNVVIYETGNVFPCEILTRKIGNIRDVDYDFKKLWKSQEADEVRKFIRDTKCFCTHECFLTTNILFNNKYALRILVGSK